MEPFVIYGENYYMQCPGQGELPDPDGGLGRTSAIPILFLLFIRSDLVEPIEGEGDDQTDDEHDDLRPFRQEVDDHDSRYDSDDLPLHRSSKWTRVQAGL